MCERLFFFRQCRLTRYSHYWLDRVFFFVFFACCYLLSSFRRFLFDWTPFLPFVRQLSPLFFSLFKYSTFRQLYSIDLNGMSYQECTQSLCIVTAILWHFVELVCFSRVCECFCFPFCWEVCFCAISMVARIIWEAIFPLGSHACTCFLSLYSAAEWVFAMRPLVRANKRHT